MSGNISEFINSFKTDVARPSRFEVIINVPEVLPYSYYDARKLTFRCENAEIPGKTFMTHDQKIYGPTEKFPYQHSYNDMNMTFIVSDDMFEKKFFDTWIERISSIDSYNFKYKTEYATTIIINQFDVSGDNSYSVSLIDAYPISVNQLDLDWSSDAHHKLAVVFAYTYWRQERTITPTPPSPALPGVINTGGFTI